MPICRNTLAGLATAALVALSTPARAQPVAQPEIQEANAVRRTVATTAAVIPGLMVRGTGHFVRGEGRTGRRLLYAQLAGLGGMFAGISGLVFTGAAPELIAPSIWFAIYGAGLFTTSYFADIYGSMNSGRGAGTPVLRAPRLRVDLGYDWINNPVFAYRNFANVGAQIPFKSVVLDARGWFAVDDDNQRLLSTLRWRLFGARPDRRASDGTYLEWRNGAAIHRHGTEDFYSIIPETSLAGRLDLERIGPTLKGLFAEAELGLAAGFTHHERHSGTFDSYLLGGFASGLYLGHGQDGWGEVAIYYDHRHDGFIAGSKVRGLGSGSVGHFGMRFSKSVYGPWGFDLRAAAGSALLVGGSVVYQYGGSR